MTVRGDFVLVMFCIVLNRFNHCRVFCFPSTDHCSPIGDEEDGYRMLQSSGDRSMPETQEAEIQAEEDMTKVRKDSADIMKESRSMRK